MYANEDMKLITLSKQLAQVCESQSIEYDPTVLPIKLTADCYIFYATPKSEQCHRHGHCKVNQYYALTGGETIQILEKV